jgi:hypothetical protein
MRFAGLVALATALGGCAVSHGVRPLRPLEIATAPYQEPRGAALTGSLMYEGGCLLFREDRTAAVILPVWPTGSVFNGTSVIFHQPAKADQPLVVGEEFVMEGQTADWPALAAATYLPFQHQCSAPPFLVGKVRPAD